MNNIIKCLFIIIFMMNFISSHVAAQNDSSIQVMIQTTKQVEALVTRPARRSVYIPMDGSIVTELDWYKKHNAELLNVLDGLYIENRLDVHKRLAKEWSRNTFAYYQSDYIGYVADSSLMNGVHLREMTRENCWQWILLYHLRHFIGGALIIISVKPSLIQIKSGEIESIG